MLACMHIIKNEHSRKTAKQSSWIRALACCAAALLAGAKPPVFAQTTQTTTVPVSTAAARVDRIIIVFKQHFDIGYTDLAAAIVQKYRTETIDKALAVCDTTRDDPVGERFVWTLPGWPMHKILEDWPGQTPERRERLTAALREGRFVLHALPFSTHTETLELEDLVRGMGFSSQICRSLGLPLPRDAKMTDVPCHTWVLPVLLKHAGVNFLHIGGNQASMRPEVPILFWWAGPDGSKLLTMHIGTYGTELTPPADWPYHTWLALIHTGDNRGPPSSEETRKLLAQARAAIPGVDVHVGRLSDFADALLAEKPDLPVVRGDLPDTWIHGPMCDPLGMKLARNIRPMMSALESLHTGLTAWEVVTPPIRDAIAVARENSLLYGEHTWGGALAWITPYHGNIDFSYGEKWKQKRTQGKFDRIESSWREHTAYIEKTRDTVAPLLTAHLQALAKAIAVKGERIVVYNPLPWPVTAPVNCAGDFPATTQVREVGTDRTRMAWKNGEGIHFIASDVPPMGYSTYVPGPALAMMAGDLRVDEGAGQIENQFFRVQVDSTAGVVRSIVDKRSGRELVAAEAPQRFGQYLYERFDRRQVEQFLDSYLKRRPEWAPLELGKPNLPPADQAPYSATSPSGFATRIETDGTCVRAIMTASPGGAVRCGLTCEVVLHENCPWIDLAWTLRDKPADPWPEAGWICLPLNVDAPRFQLSRVGSIVDPARDIVPGANHHLYALNGGLAAMDPNGRGVGLCAMDSPLVSLEVPGCWKYEREFVPHKAWVYINLFNNQWTTNFRFWNEGTWTSRVRLWSVEGYQPEHDLITPSMEARSPLLAVSANGEAGALPPRVEGLSLSSRGVAVTALGDDPDGEGLLLRLWEQAGQSAPCRVQLPAGMNVVRAEPVDLRGTPTGSAVPVNNNTLTVDLHAFAPASYRLKQSGP